MNKYRNNNFILPCHDTKVVFESNHGDAYM